MGEQDQERKQKYRRVRSDFDDLESEDKVIFLLEATVTTLARGIDEFGRAVSDELNKAFDRRARKRSGEAGATEEGPGGPGAPSPEREAGPAEPPPGGSPDADNTSDFDRNQGNGPAL